MSNKLYNALNIYFDIVKNGKKEDSLSPKELEAYMLVTRDAKLMSILNSFDKDVEPSLMDIVPKYNALIAEEKAIEPKPETPVTPEGTVTQEGPVEPVQDPTVSMVNDINRYNMVSGNNEVDARIAETQKVMAQAPDNIVGEPAGLGKKKTLSFKKSDGTAPAINPDALVPKEVPANKTLSSIGYANIVLMSIIVIIIVAIVCVFIFVK